MMQTGDKTIISKGQLKGERVTVIGITDLNMEHKIIVRRKKGRNKIMGFRLNELRPEIKDK